MQQDAGVLDYHVLEPREAALFQIGSALTVDAGNVVEGEAQEDAQISARVVAPDLTLFEIP